MRVWGAAWAPGRHRAHPRPRGPCEPPGTLRPDSHHRGNRFCRQLLEVGRRCPSSRLLPHRASAESHTACPAACPRRAPGADEGGVQGGSAPTPGRPDRRRSLRSAPRERGPTRQARTRSHSAGRRAGAGASPIRGALVAKDNTSVASPCNAGSLPKTSQPLPSKRAGARLHEMDGASGLETATGQRRRARAGTAAARRERVLPRGAGRPASLARERTSRRRRQGRRRE